MRIEANKDVIIKGPCLVSIKQGTAIISGIEVNEKIEINDDNTYTLTTIKDSHIDTNCKIIAEYQTLNWHNIASQLYGKIIVLGDINSGKTYFSNMLINVHRKGLITDADVGQSSLFLPTFVSSTLFHGFSLKLDERNYSEIEFFGSITPSTNPRLHISLTLRLTERYNESLKVIDTDGWIKGFHAYRHKMELISLFDPDFIVIFDEHIYNSLPDEVRKRSIQIKKFPLQTDRTRSKRKEYRKNKYKKYFEKADLVSIDIQKVFGTPKFNNIINSWGELLQLIPELPCEGYYIDRNTLRGLLVGLTYKGKVVGAGIIKDINEGDGIVKIQTPVKQVDGVILSNIALNEKYEEVRVKFNKC
ncbi:MAG: Clp1/GlmU family protein [Sulfolobus sp.]